MKITKIQVGRSHADPDFHGYRACVNMLDEGKAYSAVEYAETPDEAVSAAVNAAINERSKEIHADIAVETTVKFPAP